MRVSFRGFFGCCQYIINMAVSTPDHLLPPNVKGKAAISPAHSTTSVVEAWFSLSVAQIIEFDEVLKYAFRVANHLMHDGIKDTLKDNPVYDAVDVGGPVKLAKFHKKKRPLQDVLIKSYLTKKQQQPYTSPVSAVHCSLFHSDEIGDSVSVGIKRRGAVDIL